MNISRLTFTGLLRNRNISDISGPALLSALSRAGWKEGTGTHFVRELRTDGARFGINTPADLERALRHGSSEPARDGKTLHRICGGRAYVVYNGNTKTLITFSHGSPKKFSDAG
jgi:hypothetical protein